MTMQQALDFCGFAIQASFSLALVAIWLSMAIGAVALVLILIRDAFTR
jgi:hypothetical protein